MAQPANLEDEFIWSGRLAEEPGGLPAVQARCQRLRFTGRLSLLDGQGQPLGEQTWIGGQTLDGEAALPAAGAVSFRAAQRVPDLDEQLTDGVVLRGELAEGTVERIAALCSEHLLCADVVLRRPTGDEATVGFTYGRAESAMVSGEAQMALLALALLSSWDGTFEVRLRSLFGQAGPAEAPIFVTKKTRERDFDLTGMVQVESRQRPVPVPVPGVAPVPGALAEGAAPGTALGAGGFPAGDAAVSGAVAATPAPRRHWLLIGLLGVVLLTLGALVLWRLSMGHDGPGIPLLPGPERGAAGR